MEAKEQICTDCELMEKEKFWWAWVQELINEKWALKDRLENISHKVDELDALKEMLRFLVEEDESV
jgi:hypothetical protein